MTQDHVPPLKTSGDAPPELVRALRVLKDQPGDAARIDRVAQKLASLLDAPAPTLAPHTLATGLGLNAARVLQLTCAGLMVGAAALWLGRSPPPANHPPVPHAASPLSASSPSDSKPDVAPQALPGTEPPTEPRRRERPELGSTKPAPSARRRPLATQKPSLPTTRANVTRSAAPDSAPQMEATASTEAVASVRNELGAESPAPRPKSEVALLLEARQQMKTSPRAALRLLDEHAARFGGGMLAPEREAMAIQLLRELGQTEAAELRLQRFRSQYPKSLHLPRLDPAKR